MSSKNSHIDLNPGQNYEFDLSNDNEIVYAKVNLSIFTDGIKFSLKPDRQYDIDKNVDLVIFLSTKYPEPNY